MNKPHCEKCKSWYLIKDDDRASHLQVVACVMCGTRIYRACLPKGYIRRDRKRKGAKQQWK